jgi:pimeloyl-ACP methyl ester carboxylesterase
MPIIRRFFPFVLVALFSMVAIQCSEAPDEPIVPQVESKALNVRLVPPYLVSAPGGATHYLPAPPDGWQDLVVYGHGYYSPLEAPWAPEEDEVDGTSIEETVHGLGFAYASTSYPDGGGGLVVPQAVDDMKSLVQDFENTYGNARRVYIVGPSLGGIITTLAVEKYPDVFSGGLALCGPVGDFRKQIDYFGNFNVLYNYFFDDLQLANPGGVSPQPSIADWESLYEPQVRAAVAARPNATDQLIRVSKAPIDAADPSSVAETVVDVLWYNVFATNDALARFGGQPFNNKKPFRWYWGSGNDFKLNRNVERFSAESVALTAIQNGFQTSGKLQQPLVNLHTTRDPVIPYWHATLYRWKVFRSGSSRNYIGVPIFRYGHCNFQVSELLAGFAILVLKVTMQDLIVSEKVLPEPASQTRFLELAREHGARPTIVADTTSPR